MLLRDGWPFIRERRGSLCLLRALKSTYAKLVGRTAHESHCRQDRYRRKLYYKAVRHISRHDTCLRKYSPVRQPDSSTLVDQVPRMGMDKGNMYVYVHDW